MARISLDATQIDSLALKLASLGDKAAASVEAMLTRGAEVMTDGLKRGAAEYGHTPPGRSGRADGGMAGSVGVKPGSLQAGPDGGHVLITFNGEDERGQRYGAIAYYLNYGTSTISADHWIDNTVDLVKPLCTDAMEQVLNEALNS